jgi:hypothetical protein
MPPKKETIVTDLDNPIKSRKVPNKNTAYFVTINPNIPFPEGGEEMWAFADCLKVVIDKLLDPEELNNVLVWNTRVRGRDIDSSLSEFCIEKGAEKKTIHAHGLVVIKSFCKVGLGYSKLRNWLLAELRRECKARGITFDYI